MHPFYFKFITKCVQNLWDMVRIFSGDKVLVTHTTRFSLCV